MKIKQITDGIYKCTSFDIDSLEDRKIGEIRIGPEPYFYFFPYPGRPLTCRDLADACAKVKELNIALR